jgi:DNA-binding NarL/FixJ family response regulator
VSDRPVRVFGLEHGRDELLVVSAPLAPPATLTRAEQEVAAAVLAGASNAAIAKARGTSVRTVANQLSTIFRRLGVTSRGELAVKLAGQTSRRVAPHKETRRPPGDRRGPSDD